jgi:enoyl-CoA hydratase
MTDDVTYARDGAIARIVMDDGKVNVMSPGMLAALDAAFTRAAADGVVTILSSARPVFSAGFDLKVFAANDAAGSVAMVQAGAALALKILQSPTPVISAVRGHAFPMGAFLTLASDVRLGAEGDWTIGLNEVAIGIPVPGFALELARQRLTPQALSLAATTGRMVAPHEALAAGFLDQLVPAEAFETTVDATAQALTQIHFPAHALTKQRLRAPAIDAMRAAIAAELTLEAYEKSARARA